MVFEFDPAKSISNKEKHGIDFEEAQKLWEDARALITPAIFKKEDRFRLIAKIDSKYWAVIFTHRKNNIRIISVRRARKNEKEYYITGRV